MTKGKIVAAAIIGATALMLSPMSSAKAAQCGSSPAGFEGWKREFSAEAQGKGIGQAAISALMQTHYASATIGADRSQHSFRCRSTSSWPSAGPPPLSRAAGP